jgi:hypothetical protein
MAGFPTNNSLYSPDQLYRLSDGKPFSEHTLVVASDHDWQDVNVRRLTAFIERYLAAHNRWSSSRMDQRCGPG